MLEKRVDDIGFCSVNLTRTLNIAMGHASPPDPKDTHYDLEEIMISFINVPEAEVPDHYHRAIDLMDPKADDRKYYNFEYVVDWEIDEKYIEHTVSLQTLIDRGIGNYINLKRITV